MVNPHKWLFTPIDCSAFYCRQPEVLRRALSLVPEYLRTGEDEVVHNLMDYGISLGRRFRALKLWLVLRTFGRQGIAARLREHLRLAQEFAGWVVQSDQWEILAPVPLNTVCFRWNPGGLDEEDLEILNKGLLDRVNAEGTIYLTHTKLKKVFALRMAIGQTGTRQRHIREAWEKLQESASTL